MIVVYKDNNNKEGAAIILFNVKLCLLYSLPHD